MSMTVSIELSKRLQKMASPQAVDTLMRTVAVGMLGATKDRIHEEGQKANGSQIGSYTLDYLKKRVKAPYNRTNSRKIILSLTGQMENDYKVIAMGNLSYGLGFSNTFNAQKAGWAEERFGKVYALTREELIELNRIIAQWIKTNI